MAEDIMQLALEPMSYEGHPDARCLALNLDGELVATTRPVQPMEKREAVARRLTACWNNCHGIPTWMLDGRSAPSQETRYRLECSPPLTRSPDADWEDGGWPGNSDAEAILRFALAVRSRSEWAGWARLYRGEELIMEYRAMGGLLEQS